MSTALTTTKQTAMGVMAQRFNVDPNKLLETLKVTAFKGASNEEMMALVIVSNQYGLNPFTREIYAFPAKGGGIQPVVSVDGWLRLMNEHPQFDGIEFIEEMDGDGSPLSCTGVIHRKDRSRPTKVTEWFSECYRKTEPWDTRPRRMLRHKATIQAARTAFGFAGISDEEEAREIPSVLPNQITIEATPSNDEVVESEMALAPVKEPAAQLNPITAQAMLAGVVETAGHTFETFKQWASEMGVVTNAEKLTSWDEVATDEAKRLIRAKTGMINAMNQVKGKATT